MKNPLKKMLEYINKSREDEVRAYQNEVKKEVAKTVKVIRQKDTAYYIWKATR